MTWPNTLVLHFLSLQTDSPAELIQTAIDNSIKGYQRLLTFECASGGFNWWVGDDPGNRILTAMALMQFTDMAKVIETDPAVITRSQQYLVGTQEPDGSWDAGDALHGYNASLSEGTMRSTAFVVWGLAYSGYSGAVLDAGVAYLQTNLAQAEDVYTKALVANAIAAYDPTDLVLAQLIAEILEAQIVEGNLVHWTASMPSLTGSSGSKLTVETTALVAYALIVAGGYASTVESAIAHLVQARSSGCGWGSTQATIMVLRALVLAATQGMGGGQGTLSVTVGDTLAGSITVTEDNADILQYLDLQDFVGVGTNDVVLTFDGDQGACYELIANHHIPWPETAPSDVLELEVELPAPTITTGETMTVTAIVSNVSDDKQNMVMMKLGLPPGFNVLPSALEAAKEAGAISQYETNPGELVVYVASLEADETLELSYGIKPSYPVKAQLPASRAYLYYNPEIQTLVPPIEVTVTEAE